MFGWKWDGLSKEHGGLSKEHEKLKEALYRESEALKDNSNLVLSKLTSIDKFMAIEAAKRELTDNNLANNQRDIKQQINAIDRMLQSKVVDLEQENRFLRERVENLSR